ncbi:hypothetical protein [Luteolibacter sp. LG18]
MTAHINSGMNPLQRRRDAAPNAGTFQWHPPSGDDSSEAVIA